VHQTRDYPIDFELAHARRARRNRRNRRNLAMLAARVVGLRRARGTTHGAPVPRPDRPFGRSATPGSANLADTGAGQREPLAHLELRWLLSSGFAGKRGAG
jgi:hypothetical protein